MAARLEIPLVGAGGEPVDFRRTLASHGVADLPPNRLNEDAWTFETVLPLVGRPPRALVISAGSPGHALVELRGRAPGAREQAEIRAGVEHILRLDDDLSPFYEAVATDADLAWAARGAGRLLRSPTVFEDVVKTICTTNCAWSGTVRMVTALVAHLGERAPGAADDAFGRAFPTPGAMADATLEFYRDVVRAGYRGAYLRSLAASVAEGSLDLEALGRAGPDELSDDEVAARLLALPGVGPYAAAHIMMLLGRYTPLILDSWTRPKYARLTGGRPKKDATIVRRFRRYGRYAGLAFWLFLTRDWVAEDDGAPAGVAAAWT